MNSATNGDEARAAKLTALLADAPKADDHSGVRDYLAALAGLGCAPLLIYPAAKKPAEVRVPRQRRADDQAASEAARAAGHPHWQQVKAEAGVHLATTDTAVLGRYLDYYVKTFGDAVAVNVGVSLGRSRLVVVDCDTAEQMAAFLADAEAEPGTSPTVRSPGQLGADGVTLVHRDGGHFYFSVPEGVELPEVTEAMTVGDGDGAYSVLWGSGKYVLTPPSVRPEGPYTASGPVWPLPEWLADRITAHGAARLERARDTQARTDTHADPVARWGLTVPWAAILEPAGWTPTGKADGCGCPTWTAPGPHGSQKSATAHEPGCGTYVASVDPPLHIWTDNPGEPWAGYTAATGKKTFSKLQAVALLHYDGKDGPAMDALGIELTDSTELEVPEALPADFGSAPTGFVAPAEETDAEARARISGYFVAGPLALTVENLPPFPVAALPPVLRDMVVATALEIDVDPAMCAMFALGAVSTALVGRLVVTPYNDGSWIENGSVYVLVVAASGERKSPTFRRMFGAPIDALEDELIEDFRRPPWPVLADGRVAADPTETPAELDLYGVCGGVYEPSADDCDGPWPRLTASDATPEALASVMDTQGGVLSLADAEGSAFDMMLGLYSKDPNLRVYLSAYSREAVTIDRKSGGSTRLPEPSLTACLATQYEVWDQVRASPRLQRKGVVPRFAVAYTESRKSRRARWLATPAGQRGALGQEVPQAVVGAYNGLIMAIGTQLHGQSVRRVMLSPEAQAAVRRYAGIYGEIDQRMLDDDGDLTDDALTGWAAKAGGQMIRTALMLHMAEHGAEGYRLHMSARTIAHAIEIQEWFIANALAAEGIANGQSGQADAPTPDEVKAVDEWLIRQYRTKPEWRYQPVKISQVYQSVTPKKYRRAPRVRAALAVLAELNRVVISKENTIHVHPALYDN